MEAKYFSLIIKSKNYINKGIYEYTVATHLVDCMLKGSHHKWPELSEPF
jgi:hypothetical protein